MKLKFFNPDSLDKNLKATVHKSGKLGFTVDAAKKMELAPNKSAGIAMNEENPSDKSLYVVIYPDVRDNAFRVAKAGDYYYINLKNLFDSLKVNYREQSVVYDITQEIVEGQKLFKFVMRDNIRKNKVANENDDNG
jgi:hypothetical protein